MAHKCEYGRDCLGLYQYVTSSGAVEGGIYYNAGDDKMHWVNFKAVASRLYMDSTHPRMLAWKIKRLLDAV